MINKVIAPRHSPHEELEGGRGSLGARQESGSTALQTSLQTGQYGF